MKPSMVWYCPKCGREDPVNEKHPLVAQGVWKIGAKQKSFCWTCGKNIVHTIVRPSK